jgi:hypothetical protein
MNNLNDNIMNIIINIIDPRDGDITKIIYELVNKILEAPFDEELTIANLLGLTNEEVAQIEPIMQGIILRRSEQVCEKLNVNLKENHDEFGGLAYYYKFKKIN